MRCFDVPQAQRLIPLLESAFGELRGWIKRSRELSRKLESCPRGTSKAAAVERQREALLTQIREQLDNLLALGVEVKSLEGLVDFRAMRSGRQVFLCWQAGESQITHWHELDAGFGGRRQIADPGEFSPSYLS
jgi:hypothetical protein